MEIKFNIASVLIILLTLPVLVAGQGVILPSGIYMKLTGGTMVLQGNWVNNGDYSDQSGSIIIIGNTHVSGSSLNTFTNVTVVTGSMLSIDPQNSVTVNGVLTNNAGSSGFVLQSDATGTASLLHNTDNVPAMEQRYINGVAEAWHFLSSPMAAQSISGSWLPSGTYGNSTGYDLYLWNEPNNCWIYKLNTNSAINWSTVHPGANFTVGRGYLYSVQATTPTKEFIGNLNNDALNYGLTIGSADVNLKGFNLVGNPYPSSVDWQAASGWTRSDLLPSGGGYDMWIWNPAAGNYGVYNSSTGIGTNSVTRYISPMQGFFVRASTAGNLGMANGVRVHNDANAWKSATIIPGKLSVVVQSAADNSVDEAILLFGYAANQAGAAKLFSNVLTAPSLFIPYGGANYSVRYLTDTIDNPTIPVMFKPGRNGNYSFRCNFSINEFNTVMLEDRLKNHFQDLKIEPTYSFTASKTDDTNRFVLHFSSVKNQSDNEISGRIYTDGSHLIIDLVSVTGESEVFVYDVLGRKVFQQKLQGGIRHILNYKVFTRVLIVNLKNRNGSLSRKLIVNNPGINN
jgi:hypothetical protein